MGRVGNLQIKRLLMSLVAVFVLPAGLQFAWGMPEPQAALAVQSPSIAVPGQQEGSGQTQQVTPPNPPPPPEANPSPPGQKPVPSPQNPSPSAQEPEPVIKNPEVRSAPRPEIAPPTLTIPRLSRAPALEDFLSMKPQGEIAMQMVKVTGFVQRNPHDGEKVSEPTDAYLGYDQKNIYAVFVCFDDPKKVRARMSTREDIYDDDEVEIMLDTFHDRRRAYAFQTTPLGVQWDAIWTEATRDEISGNFDTSFDTVWDSKGKVTSQGFVVLMAIPFKSLRFPSTKDQQWGIILYRGIVRKNEDAFWPKISYKVAGRLGQAATLNGLEGISPGRSIDLIPYGIMRGFRSLDTSDPTNPFFQNAAAQGQAGMDAKFVIRDHFVLDLTANPDFSQVESEDPQITVNQRFEVYFPEKRPFFLENEDYFRTPLDLFFTRNIEDPSAGIRLTGKEGPYSLGLMATDDRGPGQALPSYFPLAGTRSYFTVARVSRDIFKESSVGALFTDWECPTTGEYNRVGGVDTRLKFNTNWTLDAQAVTSSSNLFGNYYAPSGYSANNCETNLFPFDAGNVGNSNHYAGPADKLELKRDGLHFSYDGIYEDISPGFVTVPGFVNRVDVRYAWQEADYRFRPKKGWIVDWGPSVIQRYVFDHEGNRLDTDYQPYIAIQGRGQTYIYLFPYEELRERLRTQDFCFLGFSCQPQPNQDYHEHSAGASFLTSVLPKVTAGASYRWGDGANYDANAAAPAPLNDPFLARQDTATGTLTFRPIKPLKIENTYLFERLRTISGDHGIFNDHIVQSKWNWQFTPQFSLRLIMQYYSLLANTPGNTVYPYTYLPTQKEFNSYFLLTYLVHPGTAIYVGYNSDLQNLNHELMQDPAGLAGLYTARGYINDSRQFFVKVSYQFRF